MARLGELRGKRLGCWCRPEPCHGDILARLADSTAAGSAAAGSAAADSAAADSAAADSAALLTDAELDALLGE